MQEAIRKFYTTEEVAKIVGISVSHLRELALAGNIKAFKPYGARRWRFTKQAVADYLGCDIKEF